MKIVIDAWLERKDPQIRFLDGNDASVLMQVGPAITRQLLERGDICIEDLQNPLNFGFLAHLLGMPGMPVANEAF